MFLLSFAFLYLSGGEFKSIISETLTSRFLGVLQARPLSIQVHYLANVGLNHRKLCNVDRDILCRILVHFLCYKWKGNYDLEGLLFVNISHHSFWGNFSNLVIAYELTNIYIATCPLIIIALKKRERILLQSYHVDPAAITIYQIQGELLLYNYLISHIIIFKSRCVFFVVTFLL